MKIAIWDTGHDIAHTVAKAIQAGTGAQIYFTEMVDKEYIDYFDVHIGYGILRGMTEVFRECDRQRKPYIHLDRGYFQPGHYDGYYRISLCGTQQTIGLDRFEPDYGRLDRLNIKILEHEPVNKGHVLLVPPTEHASRFFKMPFWHTRKQASPSIWRSKDSLIPLDEHLKNCNRVVTFNSSIGWEALRRGIPVTSDPTHSIIGAYQKLVDKPLHDNFNARRRLFGILGGLQMTLEEIRNGHLCPLITKMVEIYHHCRSG